MAGMPTGSIQERFGPKGRCFGCGPANEQGLRIQSFAAPDGGLVADWTPAPHHEAFPGVLNGGIIGALLDCHSNWAAAYHLMERDKLEAPPCCVTADFHVKLRRPTPSGQPVHLEARVTEAEGSSATVEARMTSGGNLTATCLGKFVAVKPGHPAFHRW